MAKIAYPNSFFLGTSLLNPKVYFSKIKELINAVNGVQVNVTQTKSSTDDVIFEGTYGKITSYPLITDPSKKGDTFKVINSKIKPTSVINLTTEYDSTGSGSPICILEDVTNGSFNVRIYNVHVSQLLNRPIKLAVSFRF